MKTFFKPFKPALLFFFLAQVAGISAGNCLPDAEQFIVWAVLLCAGLCGLCICLNKTIFFPVLLLFFCLGCLSIQTRLYPDLPAHHITRFLDSEKILVSGKVVSFARHYKKRYRVILSCQTLETRDTIHKRVSGRILLSIYGNHEKKIGYGDIIQFKATIKSIRNFNNPGAFDYKKYLRLQKIYGTAYTTAEQIKQVNGPGPAGLPTRWIRAIERLRVNYYDFILAHTADTNAGPLLAALITGKKEGISPAMRDLFSRAGISHLLAISGLHLSIVSLLFFSLFYWILSCFPFLLISGRSRKIAGILTLVPLGGYALFSGASPSTQRAFLMIMVLLFSFVSEREKDFLSSLSLAGILILGMDAAALFSISFQLSFMAVVCIVLGVPLLKNLPVLPQNKFISSLGLMIGVTFFAGLGTLPLTAHYFHMVSFIALVSNCLAIPVLGFMVLPLGLMSVAGFSNFPFLTGLVVSLCTRLISFVMVMAEFFISLPFSWHRTAHIQWMDIFAFYLVFFSIFLWIKGRGKLAISLFACSLALAGFNFATAIYEKKLPDHLTITILDVGQGSSTFVQTPSGYTILVDGGGFSDLSTFDTGRFIVAPFLWTKRVRQLDYVVLSHPEADHLNGLVYIVKNFKVNNLIKTTDSRNSTSYSELIQTCKKKNISVWHPGLKAQKLNLGDTRLIFHTASKNEFSHNLNENSLVFKLVYQNFSMLFPGDILWRREKRLSHRQDLDLHSKILLSPHHGSCSSSTKVFLDKVRPKSVVISCGWRNKYGFPHEPVLKRYRDMGIRIFRTDEDGAIVISSNGKTHMITPHKGE